MNRPLKLLIIARPFVFHGGVERATAGLVGALVEHGHDVHLLSPRGQGPMPGVTVHPLFLPPLPSAARVLALAVSARRAVAAGSWDVIQSHERTLDQDVYRAGVRAEGGISAGAYTVLFVGSGFARKGLATAVEAFAAFSDRSSRLVVLGKGDASDYRDLALRLGVSERVVWLGARNDPERWYAGADLVVLPSRYEPFGNVHLEALASGVPVLTSVHAGGAEVIRPGANGWIVDAVAAEPIARGLAALREAPAGGWSTPARASVEGFTYAAQARAFTGVYRRLVR